MMRRLGIFTLGLLVLSSRLCAHPDRFDIFGVDDNIKQKIYACCSEIVEQYQSESQKLSSSSTAPQEKDVLHVLKLEEKMVAKIKQVDDFAEVKLLTVYYPIEQRSFATLDIVKQSETYRIPAHNSVKHGQRVILSKDIKALFQVWDDYNTQKMQMAKANKYDFSKTSCPVMHCTWGFDQDDIKNTLPKLREGVVKHKQALFNIIKNSKNDQARADAIFILANDTNYQSLANFLINYTDDASDLVRNNVMRVLGAIVAKQKIPQLDVNRIIQALNYPYVTDRNKAAYVLLGLIKSDSASHAQVIKQAGYTLVDLLKLRQPNNHDFAYEILKEISHKNYGEYDYQSWSQWIDEEQNSKD
ncbi:MULTISPECIES: HEAT repeat domain-containing protein [unclassified Legionella]|uniref:HEAT repeat domain-containing protein n=1 Tax=unclassified Legionella TaxID=2622702 RepID=UPI0010543244|nr:MULTISPECIES: HEAT repeat domain-containing protein [unclassified Legionella]MDI9818509.1 HEAT repeat domain-containing protein [Legionella sp. PL877]